MSTRKSPSKTSRSSFIAQRTALVNDIAVALDHVLQNINKLNRSLEGVIAVGNEFGNVEALWSRFEGVMAQPGERERKDAVDDGDDQEHEEENDGDDIDEDLIEAGKRPASRST